MAWENPVTTWGQAGQTVPVAGDFNRIEENIRILGEYNRAPGYGTATGTNTKNITLSPAPSSYYEGLCFAFKNSVENTGAVTINVNGMGAKSVKKPNGNDLVSGNLKAGSVYTVRYNGTNFILQGSDSTGNATPEHVLAGKTFSNGEDTDLVGTMPSRTGHVTAQSFSQSGTTLRFRPQPGYYDGSTGNSVQRTDANFIPANIRLGVSLFGVTGSLKPAIGYNWTIQTPPLEGKDTICLYSGNGIQMCVMYEDTVNYKPVLYTRTNTTNWVQRTIPFTKYEVNSIVYGNGLYVMTGITPSKRVATSSDGISWTLRSVPFTYSNAGTKALFYADGLFIAGAQTVDGECVTSTNGTSWTKRTIKSGSTVYSLVKGNGLWVMGLDENIYTSTDGTSWVNRGKPFSQTHNVLSLGYGKGLYVAGGNNGAISTSTDGINWTQRTDLNGNVWSIVYNSGLYLAGTDTRLYSSEDGINWVQRFSEGYKCIAWGDLLLIGGYNGRFAYSSL
jgi:hypothetical protein